MRKQWPVLIILLLLALAACDGNTDWSDQASRANATELQGEICRFGSTMGDPVYSLVGCESGSWQLDVAISATRLYDLDGALDTTRPPHVGDKGVLTQEDGVWYIDVFPEE